VLRMLISDFYLTELAVEDMIKGRGVSPA